MKNWNPKTIINLISISIAILTGTCIGMFLGFLGMPQIVTCGSVAITTTLVEHILINMVKKYEITITKK